MKGYKTVIVNGALVVAPLLDFLVNDGSLVVSALAGPNAPLALALIGLVNIGLRSVTSTPVGRRK